MYAILLISEWLCSDYKEQLLKCVTFNVFLKADMVTFGTRSVCAGEVETQFLNLRVNAKKCNLGIFRLDIL